MDTHVWFRDLVAAVQVFIIPVLTYVGYTVREVRRELRELNGRTTRLEEWKVGREKHWDEHDARYAGDVAETWKAIDAIRMRCMDHLMSGVKGSD